MFKNILPVLIIIIISVISALPLLKPGLYTMHDDQQVARLFLFNEAFKSGQFPVRWVSSLGFGFGYPLFVFYPPFVYILGESIHILGFGFIDSIKIVFFLSIFLSGTSIYIFTKELWGRTAALTSSLFYMLVPYRALDVYVRGALAESFSFVWLPLILWSYYKLSATNKNLYIYLASIFLSLLMITHNLIFLPFMLIIFFYLLFLLLTNSKKRDLFIKICLTSLLTAGLSAFFYLPALFEKKFTIVDDILLVNLAAYNIHFAYPQQLWNWQWGFGGSSAGLTDGISFKVGKLHIIVSILSFLLSSILIIKLKKKPTISRKFYLITAIVTLFIFSAFMTTYYSKIIWDLLPPLGYLQFPWRLLTFTALFTSILAGAFIYLLKLPILRILALSILSILLIFTNLKLFSPQFYRTDLTDKKATTAENINWEVSLSSFEYLPTGVALKKSPLGTNIVDITKRDIPVRRAQVEQGEATIGNIQSTPTKISFEVNAQTSSIIRVNIFDFPGWVVKVNNQQVPISSDNKLKLITFNLKNGVSQVDIEFKNTLLRSLANLISEISIIGLIIIFLWYLILIKKVNLKRTNI